MDPSLLPALRLAAEYALLFSKDHPEVISAYPDSYELLPFMIALEAAKAITELNAQ